MNSLIRLTLAKGCLSYVVPTRITLILGKSQNQARVNK
ncbi:hypothetical protein HOR38_gp31 [Klebsiella phage KPV811]|uniref:Uncharacterized protein n=1 Tax=Klebsiella phage KPV811 TaxID=1913574 RepID=A0A1J0MHT3_9CAUD|nr:hypothetical protein HOR38_gp31 [Klebsiella phage KPV811]APD20686.1 hypothetical protein [Klebsiella phage KPV811]